MNRHFYMYCWFSKFCWININHNNFSFTSPCFPVITNNTNRETVTYCKYKISILYSKVTRTVSHVSTTTNIKWMFCFNQIYCIPICTYRNSKFFYCNSKVIKTTRKSNSISSIKNRSFSIFYFFNYCLNCI